MRRRRRPWQTSRSRRHKEKAGRGTRLLAALLDGIIASLMIYVPLFVGGSFSNLVNPATMQVDPAAVTALLMTGGLYALIGLIVWAAITYVLVKRNGQTIAKKLLGIKVVRADGSPASVARIFWLRNVVNGFLTVIPFAGAVYWLLDMLWIFGEERRCLHDKIADTIVVKA